MGSIIEISEDEESGVGKKCRVDSARNRDEARNTDTRCSCLRAGPSLYFNSHGGLLTLFGGGIGCKGKKIAEFGLFSQGVVAQFG